MTEPAPARSAGGLAAILASTCCLGPLVLVSLDLGGAWVPNLTMLEPFRPWFLGAAVVALFFAWRRIKGELRMTHSERPAPTDRGALVRLLIEAFPAMDAGDQRLALTLYRLLAKGRAVSPASLASALNRPVPDIERLLGQWPGVFRDDQGCIVGFWGIAVKEMAHCLEVNGNTVYAWCAWDTLFLPMLLDTKVTVTSRCAETAAPIRLIVSPGGIESAQPTRAVVSFLVPDEDELRTNVTTSFCHFVHFFRDREAGGRWTSTHPETFMLSLDEAFDIGQRVNAARYPDTLRIQGGAS